MKNVNMYQIIYYLKKIKAYSKELAGCEAAVDSVNTAS